VYIDAQRRWLTAISKSVYIAAFPEANSGTQEGPVSSRVVENRTWGNRFALGWDSLAGRDADFVGGASGDE
jgi:hypothetical protein